jgi:hypothetical protein
MNKYYMIFPLKNGIPDIKPNVSYIQKQEMTNRIDVFNFIKDKTNILDYGSKKMKFFQTYKDVSFSKIGQALTEYNKEFHTQFIQDTITYIFNIWTSPTEESEFHDFYFKMLYYYNTMGIIIFADYIKDMKIYENYDEYVLKSKAELKSNLFDSIAESSLKAILASDIDNTTKVSNYINESKEYMKKVPHNEKNKVIIKVLPSILPVGHFIDEIPLFYHPKTGWTQNAEYVESVEEYVENDIIIGFFEKAQNSLDIKFKLRKPIQRIKIKRDKRLTEKGAICKTYTKDKLLKFAKQLDIQLLDTSIPNLCNEIKNRLCQLELDERRKRTSKGRRSNVKWVYYFFEKMPIIGGTDFEKI